MDESVKKAYTEAWQVHKQFADGDDSDEFWDKLLSAESEVIKGYKEDEFIRGLFYAINREIERGLKRENK